MNDGILSQEEIDALLRGETGAPATEEAESVLSDMEKDVLGEIGNISMGTAATTLSTLLQHRVSITTPNVKAISCSQLQAEYPLPYLLIEVKYIQGISGSNLLVIKKHDAAVIADLMMGGNGTNVTDELDELQMSAVAEAMNQMMGSATTSLSSMFDQRIDIAPPAVTTVDFGKDELEKTLGLEYEQIVQVMFKMEIEGLLDSEIMQLVPLDAARDMVSNLMGGVPEAGESFAVGPEPRLDPPVAAVSPSSLVSPPPPVTAPPYQNAVEPMLARTDANEASPSARLGPVTVQPVQFASLAPEPAVGEMQNISLILDVPLDISVELGKTKKTIKEILELGTGSIIQLEKMAGEPVDLLVNGKLIAKGEVVVIDENYGVRVTAIISPMDRMGKLQ